ncbi:MAG: dipeptide epimerase [Gemmatimonadetes bacterium]|jgi:L-Ala-D/L-Glu epimerase|nr:dipeptide epimerase [Gemmatimonadota bacterium]MBT6145774.1 dipeptide epimerase [Gemmatimonadota bacterium]MBT7863267.1 dipeptide epimerase [Gemmatimonadota bacterium]
MQLRVCEQSWPLAAAFTISRGTKTKADVVVVEVEAEGHIGRGECVPYPRYDETVEGVLTTIQQLRPAMADGLTREDLQQALPAGAARNAVDCALWSWEAARAGCRVHELLGLPALRPVTTAYTLSLAEPASMEAAAAAQRHRPLLKLKLAGDGLDADRVAGVRRGAPQARIIVDANEGGQAQTLGSLLEQLASLGVELVEQPLPAAQDESLSTLTHPVPVCADESCHTHSDVPQLRDRYDLINIKLDKAGGLTEALLLRDAARAAGLGIMVGCMVGTSLSMAPAVLLAQEAEVVDLDGPLLLAQDRDPGLQFENSTLLPTPAGLWDG